jgi:hypothetical protein
VSYHLEDQEKRLDIILKQGEMVSYHLEDKTGEVSYHHADKEKM